MGINVALEQYNSIDRLVALQRLQEAGFGWVRQRLDWGALEPLPGQYAWQGSDDILADIKSANLEPVVVLDGSPAWARAAQDSGNPLAPPATPATFARFAAAFAERYHNQVRFYQIWDEPNIAPHWGARHIEPVDYALLLKVAANAIRNADPDAVILAGALAPTRDRGHAAIDEVYFLQRLYAAGAAPNFDVVAVQPFGFGYAATDDRAQNDILNFQRVKLVRQAMIAAGDGTTPIWAVRFGWNTHPASPWGIVKAADQLQFARDAIKVAQTEWPWLSALGWAIDQPLRPKDNPLWGFALTPALARALQGGGWETRRLGDKEIGRQGDWKTRRLEDKERLFSELAVWLMAGLVIVWRMVAAGCLLPWRRWGQHYRSWPLALRLSCWGGLIVIYYLATWPPLILLCLLGGGLLVAWEPRIGLWLAALLIPFYFQHKEVQWVDLHFTLAPAYALLFCLLPALTLSGLRTQPWPWPNRGGDWLALAWLVINVVSTYRVWHWPAYGRGLLEMALMPLLFYCAARLLIKTAEDSQRVLSALFFGGVGVAGFGLFAWLQGEGTTADGVLRLVGPYFSPNHTALYLERSLFIGVGLVLSGQKFCRYTIGVGCGLVAIALFLTGSRGAWLLGVPAGVAAFVGLQIWQAKLTASTVETANCAAADTPKDEPAYPRLHSTRNVPIQPVQYSRPTWQWIVLALVVLIALGLSSALFWERITNSATLLQRLQVWQAATRLWLDFPMMGIGPGGFFWRYPAYIQTFGAPEPNLLHPHNLWLEFATHWGLLGLLWLIYLIARLIHTMRHRTPQNPSLYQLPPAVCHSLLAALIAALVHAQVDAFMILPDLALWNWLLLALLLAI